MYCSLVRFTGAFRQKIMATEYQEVAENAGVKFIHVRHVKEFGITCASPRGFQGVVVQALPGQLGVGRYKVMYTKDHLGNDVGAMFPLDFVSNRKTQELTALIPDTEYNRRKLAACYYHFPFCTIIDQVIRAEIVKIADEIEKILPKEKPVEQVVVEYADKVDELQKELAIERKLREEAERSADIISVARAKIDRERKADNAPKEVKKSADVKKQLDDHFKKLKKAVKTKPQEEGKDVNDPAASQSD